MIKGKTTVDSRDFLEKMNSTDQSIGSIRKNKIKETENLVESGHVLTDKRGKGLVRYTNNSLLARIRGHTHVMVVPRVQSRPRVLYKRFTYLLTQSTTLIFSNKGRTNNCSSFRTESGDESCIQFSIPVNVIPGPPCTLSHHILHRLGFSSSQDLQLFYQSLSY